MRLVVGQVSRRSVRRGMSRSVYRSALKFEDRQVQLGTQAVLAPTSIAFSLIGQSPATACPEVSPPQSRVVAHPHERVKHHITLIGLDALIMRSSNATGFCVGYPTFSED